jgi:hypothetical protein
MGNCIPAILDCNLLLNSLLPSIESRNPRLGFLYAFSIVSFRIKPNHEIQNSEKHAIGGLFMDIGNDEKVVVDLKKIINTVYYV